MKNPLSRTPNGRLKEALLAIQDSYSDDTRHFISFLDQHSLDLDYDGLIAYAEHLGKSGSSAQTYNKRVIAAKNRIRYLFEHSPDSLDLAKRYRLEQALGEIRLKKIASKAIDEDKILSERDIERLVRRTSKRLSPMISFSSETGCRVSGMTAIRLTDVTQRERYCEVRILGKGNKERILKVKRKLLDSVRERFCGKRYLFETQTGNPYDRRYVSGEIKKAGKRILDRNDVSAHTLRHSFATNMIARTGNIKGVSKYLGHSSTAITLDMYVHADLTWEELEG